MLCPLRRLRLTGTVHILDAEVIAEALTYYNYYELLVQFLVFIFYKCFGPKFEGIES